MVGYEVKPLSNSEYELIPYPKKRSKSISIKIPIIYVEKMDELVLEGKYTNRSEVIRTAIRELLRRENKLT